VSAVTAHQRQGRALHQDPHRALGLRGDLRLLDREDRRPVLLAALLQSPATAQLPRPPDPGREAGVAPWEQRVGAPQL